MQQTTHTLSRVPADSHRLRTIPGLLRAAVAAELGARW